MRQSKRPGESLRRNVGQRHSRAPSVAPLQLPVEYLRSVQALCKGSGRVVRAPSLRSIDKMVTPCPCCGKRLKELGLAVWDYERDEYVATRIKLPRIPGELEASKS